MSTVLERLAAHSEWRGECLVWTGALCTKGGYGKFQVDGRTSTAHRSAWIARHGKPPPETPNVLHRCDNPPCWRDEHLWLGTTAQNNADRAVKRRSAQTGRTHCPSGHPYSPKNTYERKDRPGRICKTCRREALTRMRRRRGVPARQ